MTVFVPVMMFGWIPFTMVLFALLGSQRAAPAALILGYLFLPVATISFSGLPNLTKIGAICIPILLSTILFDSDRLRRLRPTKLDIPIIIWCVVPFASSLSNALGIYDGFSGVLRQTIQWGFPYAIGKMYFTDLKGLRELAIWLVIGGLIYIPFCVWEMRMSPNLHYYLYGFRTDRFTTTYRFGGYRPVVFLQHGIAVGFWMMSSLFMCMCLWRNKAVTHIFRFALGLHFSALLIIFPLIRSLNAILLFIIGFFSYIAIRAWHIKVVIFCIALLPIFYVATRTTGMLSTDRLVSYAAQIDTDRSRSLYGRLFHEELLIDKAMIRPIFGWGGWGRNRIYNDRGEDISVTDGLWILAFGIHGLVGLISLLSVLLLPTVLFYRKFRHLDWMTPQLAPILGFVIILALYTIDCLMNAMVNPVYTVASGGILGWLGTGGILTNFVDPGNNPL